MPVLNANALPTRNLKGEDLGATISLILNQSEPGHGPRLQPRRANLVCIHANPTFVTEWLE